MKLGLMRIQVLFFLFFFSPGVPPVFAGNEPEDADVDIQRENTEGNLDHDDIYFSGMLREEIDPEGDPNIPRESIGGENNGEREKTQDGNDPDDPDGRDLPR